MRSWLDLRFDRAARDDDRTIGIVDVEIGGRDLVLGKAVEKGSPGHHVPVVGDVDLT